MQIKTKKILILFFLVFYILSFYFNQFYYFLDRYFSVYAKEQQIKKDNLYLIFVEKNLYSQIKNDLKRYAVEYIQHKYYNTIAKVVIVDNNLSASDILKYIQKQYFDNTGSILRGIVLVGNLPIPILNYKGYIFPSVYPYVDLVDKKYIYNPETGFFDYVGGDNKPEISHSIIKFSDISDYYKFFDKLKRYYKNPSNFVSKKFYYEDFLALKTYFDKDNQPYYVNSLIFTEDILNHHFTNLLLKLLEFDYINDVMYSLNKIGKDIEDYEKETENSLEEYFKVNPEYAMIYKEYYEKAKNFVNKWKKSGSKYLSGNGYLLGNIQGKLPTKLIPYAIKNFIKPITQLFSPSYVEKIYDNINQTGRWRYTLIGSGNVDYALKEIVIKDKMSGLKIQTFNNFLRRAIDKKIEENKYYMVYPIFTYYQQYRTHRCESRYLNVQYENFYFGKYAGDITGSQDFTIYRGTYKNYTKVSQISGEDIRSKDLGTIGKSFGFMQRQIEANRGYDVLLTDNDSILFKNTRCTPRETLKQWSIRYWGGASPLNVDWKNFSYTKPNFYFYNYKYAWNPSWNRNIGGWLFDLGGSVLTNSEISLAYDWKAYKKYSAIVKIFDRRNISYCQNSNKVLMNYPEFFDKYGKVARHGQYYQVSVSGNGKVKNYISHKSTCICWRTVTDKFGKISTYCAMDDYEVLDYYYYKLVDTRVRHVSPTIGEIKKVNDVTQERPIDDPKYITFLGIGGDTVKFVYPDLWKVPVYKKVNNKYVLKSVPEIKQSIKEYLRSIVDDYNKKLKEQLDKSVNYYLQHKDAFDFLEQVDKRATPKRSYRFLPRNYLIEVLGEQNIDILAEALYYRSLGWSTRPISSNFIKNIDYLRKNFNINEKINYIIKNYFGNKKNDPGKFLNSESQGYEAGLINSNGEDNIGLDEKKSKIISDIDKAKYLNSLGGYNSDLDYLYDNPSLDQDNKCGIPSDGAVPLFQWPSAFACWLSSLPSSFEVKFTNECSSTLGNGDFCNTVEYINSEDNDIYPKIVSKDTSLSTSGVIDKYFRYSYNEFVKRYTPDLWEEYQRKGFSKYVIYDKLVNNLILDRLSDYQKSIYNKLKNFICISVYPNNFISVEDKYKNLNLFIKANDTSLGYVNISVGVIGKSCSDGGKIYLGNVDICKYNYDFVFNTYKDTLIPIKVDSNIAGDNLMQIKICKDGVCILKDISLLVSPGKLVKIDIVTLGDRIIDGGKMPVRIDGYDLYGNKIDQSIGLYKVNVNFGSLIVGNRKVKSYEFSNFNDAKFILDLGDERGLVGKNLTISLEPVFDKINYPVGKKNLKIVKSKIILPKNQIIFNLPDNFDSEFSKQLEINLAGKISSPITVKSKRGLIKVYSEMDGKTTKGDYFVVKDGVLKLVLKPIYKVGSDEVIFDVPGLQKRILKVKILHASPKKVEIDLNKQVVKSGDNIRAQIKVKDIWGNLVDKKVNVRVGVDLGLKFKDSDVDNKVLSVNSKETIDLVCDGKYSKGYIWAKVEDLDLNSQIPDYKSVFVKKINWPVDGVKVMYLSLFGNDWGNLRGYFSDNKNIATNLLVKGDKTLAITTQLVDPKKINKTLTVVEKDGRIINLDAKDITLILSGFKIYYGIDGIKIDLGKVTDYDLTTSLGGGNKIVYIPIGTDNIIYLNEIDEKNKQIKINGKVVIDFNRSFISPEIKIVFYNGGFKILWNNKYVGNLIIRRGDSYILNNNFDYVDGDNRLLNGKNVGIGLMIVNTSKDLYEDREGVGGILLSVDPEKDVGFKVFPNINLWSAGKNVGEATLKDANEFVINFGDMFLERIDENNFAGKTIYDGSKGDLIYFDEKGGIKKVLVGDFNNDNLKDILVAYKDGKIRLLKNYGLDINPFIDLGDLIVIKNGIKDIYLGDVNKDGYDDLIIWTQKDQLIYYENKKGYFSIDGKLICIDIPGGPFLKNIKQLFVSDMDGDGKLDIVTNDVNGNIKIFYGNTYVSNFSYKCNKNRKSVLREKTVISYGLILKQDKVYDKSLVHWYGLVMPSPLGRGMGTVVDKNGHYVNTNFIVKDNNGNLQDLTYDKIFQLYNAKIGISFLYNQKYIVVPSNIGKPVYETGTADGRYYVVSGLLTGTDGIKVYKRFEKLDDKDKPLKKGDLVKITVYIKNLLNNSRKLTYLDALQGPWKVNIDSSGYIVGFDKGNLNSQVILNTDVDPFIFKLDNIDLKPFETVYFSRYVSYLGTSPVNIDVGKFIKGGLGLPQIKISPVDGCVKRYIVAVNNGKDNNRSYDFRRIDLQKYVKWYIKNKTQLVANKIENIQRQIDKGNYEWVLNRYLSGAEDISDIEFSEGEDLHFDDILSNNTRLDISVFESKAMDRFAGGLEDFTKNLCKGFSLGGDDGTKCGLEPPYNTAFFAPGIYNIFGCPLAWDPGRSVFWYPGTKWLSCGSKSCCIPIPMPNKTSISTSTDPPNQFKPDPCPGVFPSTFRFYIAPTTTLGVGFAFCFGTYLSGLSFPHPWGTIAGNCVVVAKKDVLCKDKQKQQNNDDLNQYLEDWEYDLSSLGECNKDIWGVDGNLSPFNVVYKNSNLSLDNWESDEWFDTNLNGFEIGGNVLKLQRNYIGDTLKAKEILLKKGKPIHLKIEGGNLKGLVNCIIRKWLDRQIRYIINALTNMTIYIYFPDLSQLSQGWDKLKDLYDLKNDVITSLSTNWEKVKDSLKDKEKGGYTYKSILLPKKEVFGKLSETFANPFRQIEKFFENIPLINIYTRSIVIKLPRLTEEEWERQKAYLNQWLDENKEIINEWKKLVVSSAGKCERFKNYGRDFCDKNYNKCVKREGRKKEECEKEKQQCMLDYNSCEGTYQKYLKIYTNIKQIENRVKQDIEAIDAWQRFPLQLYAYLHRTNRLLLSILCIIDKFFLSVVRWFHQNAVRFEKWVEFIILMIAVIKTWQILIDFSVKWKRSCGKCRVDNYDFYDCTLSVFCIDLPILPIPPFKLPDVYVDLTHIDIGLNVTLPEFKFKPIRLPQIVLPTLPYPPKVGLNVRLPIPPRIPMPPQLSSVTFNFSTPRIKLPPLLPPAPKLPPLLPPIKVVLDIAQWIGKIRCIIKNGIGLVAEWNTKTRIEQLTQRYSRVAPFDFIQLTLPKSPFPTYYDVRIDTYVNLKIDFDMVYDIAKAFANVINGFSNGIIDEINRGTMKVEDGFNENSIIIPDINERFDFQSFNKLFYKSKVATGNYFENYRNRLLARLDILESKSKYKYYDIKSLKDILRSPVLVGLNFYGLNEVKNNAKKIIYNKMKYYKSLANQIKKGGWNELFKIAGQNKLIYYKKDRFVSLSTNIINVNPKLKQFIKNTLNPYKVYFKINKKIVDGLYKKVNQKSYYAFGMTRQDRQYTKVYLKNLKFNIDKAIDPTLYYGNSINNVGLVSKNRYFGLYNFEDISQFINGFYVTGLDNKYRNIIYDTDFADSVRKEKSYLGIDFNGDRRKDFVLRTEDSIYIKWSNQKKYIKSVRFSKNYYTDYNEEFLNKPIYDFEVNKFRVNSFRYDDVGISWLGDGYTDLYLIKLESRIDISYDNKNYIKSIFPPDRKFSRYIIVMYKDLDPGAIRIDYKDLEGFVYDLQKDGNIILKQFSSKNGLINLHLKIDPREWRYARIVKLKNISPPDFPRYVVNSCWSNQIVFGRSIHTDDVPPSDEIILIRSKTGKIVSKGKSLYGYINTNYRLKIQWKDNCKVVKSWISDSKGKVIKEVDNGIIEINVYSDEPKQIVYYVGAVDQNGNSYRQQIEVNIKVPTIFIDRIKVNNGYAQIITKLSNQIDEGQIKFYRNRFGQWELLTGWSIDGEKKQFVITRSNNYITGGLFSFEGNLLFKDISGQIVGLFKSDGELILQDPYEYVVDISQGYPLLLIYNSKKGKIEWKVFLNTSKLVDIDSNGIYKVLNLEKSFYGIFNSGKCILNQSINQCVMYIASKGLIYVPIGYRSDWNKIDYKVEDGKKVFIFNSSEGKVKIYSK